MSVVIGTPLQGYDLSGSPALTPPGLEYLGNQYVFLHAGGSTFPNADGILHSFKSTDGGLTWREVGSGPFTGFNYEAGYCICQDDTTVYAVYVRITDVFGVRSIAGISVATFDLTTDAWGGSTNYAFPVVDFIQVIMLQMCLVLRGPGDMIFYYSGPQDTGHSRVYYAPFTGSGFGSSTQLPGQTLPSNYYPQAATVDAAKTTHFFYSNVGTGTLGFSVYHYAMDVHGAFGSRELITDAGYLVNQTGTFSAPVAFLTSNAKVYIAFAGLLNNDLLGATQSQHLFYAEVPTGVGVGGLTWQDSLITTGIYGDVNPNILFWESSQVQAVSITIAFLQDTIVCAWTFVPFSGGPGWTSGDSFVYQTQTPFPTISWATPAVATTTTFPFFEAAQVGSWSMPTSKKIGTIVFSVGIGRPYTDQQEAQFSFIDVLPPPKKSKGKFVGSPFIDGQFRKPHRLGPAPTP